MLRGVRGAYWTPCYFFSGAAPKGYRWMSLSAASSDDLSRARVTNGGGLFGLFRGRGAQNAADDAQAKTLAPNGKVLVAVSCIRCSLAFAFFENGNRPFLLKFSFTFDVFFAIYRVILNE